MGSSDREVALFGSGRGYIITVFLISVIRCAASNDHKRHCRKRFAKAYSSINDRIAPIGKAGAGGICTLGHWRSLVSAAFRNQLPKLVASVMPVFIRIAWTPFDVWAVLFSATLASGSL